MPSDHSRTHHSAQCGRVAAGIAGDSPSLFHSVPVGMGHGGVSFPVCKCKCFCLTMQKFWFRHICIVRMSWVVGLSPTVGFLPEGTCTFCSGACRTCTLGSGRSLRNMPRLFLPAYISVFLLLWSASFLFVGWKSVICLATEDYSECSRLCILKAASQSLSDSPCQLSIWTILMHLVGGSTLLHQQLCLLPASSRQNLDAL